MAVITLDRGALDQARAIVDRESPTPRQETRFEWTARLVLATTLLVPVWAVTAIARFYQWYFFIVAWLACMTTITLFALNAGFVSRLWRSYRTAKRLGLHWRHTKRTSRGWAWLACLAVIHIFVGYPLLFVSVFGLGAGIDNRDPVEFLAALSMVSFGVGCLLLLPMDVVHRRVNAMRALRGALDSTQPSDAGNVEVPAREYDRITDLEFQHIVIDSLQSLANVDTDAGSAVRLRRAFQEAVANLPEAQSDLSVRPHR